MFSYNFIKVLGFGHLDDANKDSIIKAYKKVALLTHPDKNIEADKEIANKAFICVKEARDMLLK